MAEVGNDNYPSDQAPMQASKIRHPRALRSFLGSGDDSARLRRDGLPALGALDERLVLFPPLAVLVEPHVRDGWTVLAKSHNVI